MSSLRVEGIVKEYGKKKVLHGIDLELEPGKIYGLIGRNGAGKTTLLSILSAQNPASSGCVTLDEQMVWENPDALSHICFARELNPVAGNAAGTMKVKEYLKIAASFFPYWDQEMSDRLIMRFHLDVKKRSVSCQKECFPW